MPTCSTESPQEVEIEWQDQCLAWGKPTSEWRSNAMKRSQGATIVKRTINTGASHIKTEKPTPIHSGMILDLPASDSLPSPELQLQLALQTSQPDAALGRITVLQSAGGDAKTERSDRRFRKGREWCVTLWSGHSPIQAEELRLTWIQICAPAPLKAQIQVLSNLNPSCQNSMNSAQPSSRSGWRSILTLSHSSNI